MHAAPELGRLNTMDATRQATIAALAAAIALRLRHLAHRGILPLVEVDGATQERTDR